jgi:hypothetical protein
LAYAKNLKFGMEVALNKTTKKIMLNKQWLLWLPDDVITNVNFLKIDTFLYRAISPKQIEIFQFCFDFLQVK